MILEELKAEHERLMNAYYDTKASTNRTTDTVEIGLKWDQSREYWQQAVEIQKKIDDYGTI